MIPAPWRDGEVAVIGLGRSGSAAATWLASRGVAVYASDAGQSTSLDSTAAGLREQGVTVDLGGHDVPRIARAAAVVVSPGVPPGIEALVAARASGVEILSELDLAVRNLDGVRFVVVTGTNGKTTTTALAAHLLQAAGYRAEAAGNIGRPLITLATDDPPEWCVVEASSFQLHDSPHLVADIGVLTNLAPDHHERYESIEAYYEDKRKLFQAASDRSRWVVNGDDAAVLALADGVPGTRTRFSLVSPADAWYDREARQLVLEDEPLLPRLDLPLLGDHNVGNALAASLAARAAGVPGPVISHALPTFSAPAHRLEPVAKRKGRLWVNDSKATNVASAVAALRAMDGPFVWIAGGRDKGEDFGPLREVVHRCRLLVTYGEAGTRLATALQDVVDLQTEDLLHDAVEVAVRASEHGDTILLSPACSSFDQFANFEDRGEWFRRLAYRL